MQIPLRLETMIKILEDEGLRKKNPQLYLATIQEYKGRNDVIDEILLKIVKQAKNGNSSLDEEIMGRSVEALKDSSITIKQIDELLKQHAGEFDKYCRLAAMNACIGRSDIPMDFIKFGIEWPLSEKPKMELPRAFKDGRFVREAAIDALLSMDVPLSSLESWLEPGKTLRGFALVSKAFQYANTDVGASVDFLKKIHQEYPSIDDMGYTDRYNSLSGFIAVRNLGQKIAGEIKVPLEFVDKMIKEGFLTEKRNLFIEATLKGCLSDKSVPIGYINQLYAKKIINEDDYPSILGKREDLCTIISSGGKLKCSIYSIIKHADINSIPPEIIQRVLSEERVGFYFMKKLGLLYHQKPKMSGFCLDCDPVSIRHEVLPRDTLNTLYEPRNSIIVPADATIIYNNENLMLTNKMAISHITNQTYGEAITVYAKRANDGLMGRYDYHLAREGEVVVSDYVDIMFSPRIK